MNLTVQNSQELSKTQRDLPKVPRELELPRISINLKKSIQQGSSSLKPVPKEKKVELKTSNLFDPLNDVTAREGWQRSILHQSRQIRQNGMTNRLRRHFPTADKLNAD